LEDCKGAAERLHAAALLFLRLIVDILLHRLDQLGDISLAQAFGPVGRLLFGAWSHGSGSPCNETARFCLSLAAASFSHKSLHVGTMLGPRVQSITISIDVQYYEK